MLINNRIAKNQRKSLHKIFREKKSKVTAIKRRNRYPQNALSPAPVTLAALVLRKNAKATLKAAPLTLLAPHHAKKTTSVTMQRATLALIRVLQTSLAKSKGCARMKIKLTLA